MVTTHQVLEKLTGEKWTLFDQKGHYFYYKSGVRAIMIIIYATGYIQVIENNTILFEGLPETLFSGV